jgi:rSAM/selenodomain-associated transferase 2/rSAM/selenodomain-associated transferase 1
MATPSSPTLGIVIPTLNEEEHLPLLLEDISHFSLPHAVVISDGGSRDGTRDLGRGSGGTIVESLPGRARQMDAGAAALTTPWLLFLHADVRIPPPSAQALEEWLHRASPRDVGTFAFALEGGGGFWRMIEFGQRIREGLLGLAYGDQGLLVHRDLFKKAGGFGDLPLMEDVDLLRRLRRLGHWKRIPAPILTSPRRYREEGRWFGWLRNTILITLYLAGVSPSRLARFYRTRRPPDTSTLLVFAKAPVPGRVKTRLAVDVGDEEAARIYSRLGKTVVDQVKTGSYRTVICFDPPTAGDAIGSWLGTEGLSFAPQSEGELGSRMEKAVEEALRTARKVVVVGTDAPDVTRGVAEEAFGKLDGADLVLGPATDGGYYLIGMKGLIPGLFEGIPWSTPEVLEATLDRARALGLRVELLSPLQDVDTLEDWERLKAAPGQVCPPSLIRK